MIQEIEIDRIRRRDDARPLNDAVLAALSESIAEIGLINPLRVRRVDSFYEIVAGSRRFAACDLHGMRAIPCIVVDDDDLRAELAMIDENLCRAELSPVDRAKQTSRRKAIYLELHPETAHGSPSVSRQVGDTHKRVDSERFTIEVSKLTGNAERSVQRDAERGEKVTDEAASVIRGTRLDTGTYLDQLKRVPAEQQAVIAARDLSQPTAPKPKESHRERVGKMQAPADAFAEFIRLTDQIEAFSIADLIHGAGRQRAVLGQRASGLADRMTELLERMA